MIRPKRHPLLTSVLVYVFGDSFADTDIAIRHNVAYHVFTDHQPNLDDTQRDRSSGYHRSGRQSSAVYKLGAQPRSLHSRVRRITRSRVVSLTTRLVMTQAGI